MFGGGLPIKAAGSRYVKVVTVKLIAGQLISHSLAFINLRDYSLQGISREPWVPPNKGISCLLFWITRGRCTKKKNAATHFGVYRNICKKSKSSKSVYTWRMINKVFTSAWEAISIKHCLRVFQSERRKKKDGDKKKKKKMKKKLSSISVCTYT